MVLSGLFSEIYLCIYFKLICISIFFNDSYWLLPGSPIGVWPGYPLRVSASHLGLQNQLQPTQRYDHFRPFKCLLSLLPLTQCLFPDRSGRSSVKGLLLQTCYQRVLEKGNPRLHDSRDAGKGLCQWPVFNAVQTLLLKTDLCSTIFHFLSLLRSSLSCWKWSCWTWEIPAPSSPQHSHLPTSLT